MTGKKSLNQPQGSNIENPGVTAEPLVDNKEQKPSEPVHHVVPEARGKRTVSSRKVEANRRNLGKSTGPKTPGGKKRVSRNAVKHGFYSKWLLVQHQDGGESQAEYDELHAGIAEHFQPTGWRGEDLLSQRGLGAYAG